MRLATVSPPERSRAILARVPPARAARAAASVVLCALALGACGGAGRSAVSSSAAGSPVPPATGAASQAVPDGDWTQFNYDAQRSGVGPAQTGITASNLSLLRRQTVSLDGTVDSSPIQLAGVTVDGRKHDLVIVTTTYGRTIALAAGTGAKLWEYVPPDIGTYQGSAQFTTASPIFDPDRRFVYTTSPNGYIHKLAIATGRQVWKTRVTYDPTHEKLPAALNISGSSVVVTTGGYIGDAPPYQGHVVLIDRASGRITHVWNALCSDRHYLIDPPSACRASDAAIWGRAGAVIEPGSGRLMVATGNAPFNGSTDWGDSVLELSPDLTLLHHWTPVNQAELNNNDEDLGSTSPALLPGGLAVQGGKAGVLSLLAVNRLSSVSGSAGARLGGELQDIPSPAHAQLFSASAVWTQGGRTYVFVSDYAASNAYVLSIFGRLRVLWRSGTPGTSPVLAGGLLYVYDPVGGRLDVLVPTTGRSLASLPASTGHWNSPIVVGGRIILPVGNANDHGTSGTLYIWHLPGR
jgi:PQQ-like domain